MLSSKNGFGVKEVADVTFYKLEEDGSIGEAVICLDTLKVSNIEQTAENTAAKGGKGNGDLIMWDYGREINIALEDALLSDKTLEMAYGGANEDGVITISANTFPGVYYIEGSTFARDINTGKDEIFKFIIPKAKIQSENTISMEAEGDPTVFTMNLRALRGADGIMMKLMRIPEIIASGDFSDWNSGKWSLSGDGVLTLKGMSELRYQDYNGSWEPYLSQINSLIVEEGITGGSADFFYETGLIGLDYCYLPASLSSLSSEFFFQAELKKVQISKNNPAYYVDSFGVVYDMMNHVIYAPVSLQGEYICSAESIEGEDAFAHCKVETFYFTKAFEMVDKGGSTELFNDHVKFIYVPFDEEDYFAENAPWGADNAAVIYNWKPKS